MENCVQKLLHLNASCLKFVIVKRPCVKLANQMDLATGTDILKSQSKKKRGKFDFPLIFCYNKTKGTS